jgi:3-deoxy-D-manno-octulosonate 8-phosphate phosphatase (KDO 8-P phosphatase)
MEGLNFKQRLAHVQAMVFDVDGVFTDGSILIMEQGQPVRTMNVRDGYALQLAVKKGLKVCIITGGSSEAVAQRFRALGITDIHLRAHNKLDVLTDFLAGEGIDPTYVLYMGDDMPDLPCLRHVGVPTCPADAAYEIRDASIYLSPYAGGHGCVRDVVEQVLKVKGLWADGEAFGW